MKLFAPANNTPIICQPDSPMVLSMKKYEKEDEHEHVAKPVAVTQPTDTSVDISQPPDMAHHTNEATAATSYPSVASTLHSEPNQQQLGLSPRTLNRAHSMGGFEALVSSTRASGEPTSAPSSLSSSSPNIMTRVPPNNRFLELATATQREIKRLSAPPTLGLVVTTDTGVTTTTAGASPPSHEPSTPQPQHKRRGHHSQQRRGRRSVSTLPPRFDIQEAYKQLSIVEQQMTSTSSPRSAPPAPLSRHHSIIHSKGHRPLSSSALRTASALGGSTKHHERRASADERTNQIQGILEDISISEDSSSQSGTVVQRLPLLLEEHATNTTYTSTNATQQQQEYNGGQKQEDEEQQLNKIAEWTAALEAREREIEQQERTLRAREKAINILEEEKLKSTSELTDDSVAMETNTAKGDTEVQRHDDLGFHDRLLQLEAHVDELLSVVKEKR